MDNNQREKDKRFAAAFSETFAPTDTDAPLRAQIASLNEFNERLADQLDALRKEHERSMELLYTVSSFAQKVFGNVVSQADGSQIPLLREYGMAIDAALSMFSPTRYTPLGTKETK